jgi:hypothetical protein
VQVADGVYIYKSIWHIDMSKIRNNVSEFIYYC